MAEWRATTLGELCAEGGGAIQTGPFGSQLHASDYVADGVPSVMPMNIGDNVIAEDGIARITPSDAARLSRYLLAEGDIIYSRRGDVEKRALVRAEHAGWLCGTGCLRVRLGESATADPRFISYLLGTEDSRAWIVRHAVGATMPNLNTAILSGVPLAVPILPEQRAIAEVLGALDDKIAANTRLIALGGAQLDAEFERAVAGRSVQVPLSAVAEFQNRRRIPLSSREREERPGLVPYYGASGIFGWVDQALFDERLLLVGEDGSVITEDRHPVTQYIWGPAWVNNHAHVLVGHDLSTELLYLAVRRADVSTLVTGAVQPKISMGNLRRLEIRVPDQDTRCGVEEAADAWFGVHRALVTENRTLAATRDALLPALMSGKLRVRDAERLAEAHT